jgi:hypothetical protein
MQQTSDYCRNDRTRLSRDNLKSDFFLFRTMFSKLARSGSRLINQSTPRNTAALNLAHILQLPMYRSRRGVWLPPASFSSVETGQEPPCLLTRIFQPCPKEMCWFVFFGRKCNGLQGSVSSLVETLNGGKSFSFLFCGLFLWVINVQFPPTAQLSRDTEVVVCPPAIHLNKVASTLRPDIGVSAQDVWHKGSGAYTGDMSPEMLVDG